MARSNQSALAYHEPSVEIILIQSSFLILLNIVNWCLDKLLYCGLIGQILIGIAWGTPGGRILSPDTEGVVVQLGYIGLILLVFEGGLSTSFSALRANAGLSTGVAITGIAAPIGLSFMLAPLVEASSLQCFAAGAALCSTSLGTTFAVLRASGLSSTRLGVVLTCAAMLDDVAGLVMVQVISNLGSAQTTSTSAIIIVRPILVSLGFIIAAFLGCTYLVHPVTLLLNSLRTAQPDANFCRLLRWQGTSLTLYSALPIALIAAASYAGTSNLFAAYMAGAIISWWDSEVPHHSDQANTRADLPGTSVSGLDIFEDFYHPAVKRVFQPFFFASIGFSIPVSRMFSGSVIWRGLVYSVFMMMAKLFCGLWLMPFPDISLWLKGVLKHRKLESHQRTAPHSSSAELDGPDSQAENKNSSPNTAGDLSPTNPPINLLFSPMNENSEDSSPAETANSEASKPKSSTSPAKTQKSLPNPPKPISLYPGAIIGLAMVARGEIGFLVSSVAQSNDIFGNSVSGESELFLIVTWAIVLCTVVGPLSVGLLVRRAKRLESRAISSARDEEDASSKDVFGVWGVQAS